MTKQVTVDFCGEIYNPEPGDTFTIGRDADLVIDDENPFLHRVFLTIEYHDDMWWLSNVGSMLTATVADGTGAMQTWLAPGASIPLVMPKFVVWFTAGATTYDFDIFVDAAVFVPTEKETSLDGTMTIGRVQMTPDQKILIVALCEDVLRKGDRGAGAIPTSKAAAERLGWTLTKFNRKLDNVCQKLADMGVRGLHGGPTKLATSRKARLVEYAMSSRTVTVDDLAMLP